LGALCAGISDRAIIEAANRFAAGDVQGQSKTFAPSGPEFVAEVRRRQELIDIQAKPRLPRPEYHRHGPAPWEITRDRLKAKHANRPVLFTDIGHGQFMQMQRDGQIPVGGIWVAALATIYGPERQSVQQAAE
jgi:hypothetical protein